MRPAAPGYLFVAPAFALLFLVLGYPAAASLWLSLQPAGGGPGPTLDHYAALARSATFWQVVATTAWFVLASVAVHLLLGLAVALALHRPFPGRTLARVVMLLPWVVPDVVAGIVWKWVFNPLYGVLNDLLLRAGLVDQPVDWLAHPALALPSVIVANIWRGFPFVMIVLLAGLQGIREDLYEAAAIDGAGPLARFRDVTLPGLRKVLVVALALDTVWEVRRFGLVQAMTGGGPGIATEVLSTQVFRQYFQFFRFEYASAMAIAMTGLLLVLSLPYVRMIVREEE
jgi:multiple sugar transport system permease protein